MKPENEANKTHFIMGKRVREFIEENGGVLPENYPTKKNLKELEKERNYKSKVKIETKLVKS